MERLACFRASSYEDSGKIPWDNVSALFQSPYLSIEEENRDKQALRTKGKRNFAQKIRQRKTGFKLSILTRKAMQVALSQVRISQG